MKRSAALVFAVGLVVLSLVVRSRIDDSGGGGGGSGSTGGRRPVVACVTELAEACRTAYGSTVDLRVEDAGVTAKALVAGSAGIDDWVTLDGWPQLVAQRSAAGGTVTPVASTPLVIAAVKERADALAAACGDAGWRCLLSAVGRPWVEVGGKVDWGTVKVAVGPKSSALGLLVRANAVTAFAAEGTDVGTNDADYATAVAAIDRADSAADPLTRFFLVFPATYSAVGTTGAQLEASVGTYRDRVSSTAPVPPAQAIAVVAQGAGKQKVDGGRLAKALTAAGWTAPPATDAALPDPGVLLALSGI